MVFGWVMVKEWRLEVVELVIMICGCFAGALP
jgi:hypothetical protein